MRYWRQNLQGSACASASSTVTPKLLALCQGPSSLCKDMVTTQPIAAGLQELELEQTHLCLHEASSTVDYLSLELERSARTQAEQYSKLRLELEYKTRVCSSKNCVLHTVPLQGMPPESDLTFKRSYTHITAQLLTLEPESAIHGQQPLLTAEGALHQHPH